MALDYPNFVIIPWQMAVLPVDGGPAINTALPAIFPASTIFKITPAALRADNCPPSLEHFPLVVSCRPILVLIYENVQAINDKPVTLWWLLSL